MRVAMHQPHYLPWLGYLDKMDAADLFVIVDHVQFARRNWQNRNYVKSASGPVLLTVPVAQRSRSERIVDKLVDDSRPWRRKHRATLEQCYADAPYWDAYGGALLAPYTMRGAGEDATGHTRTRLIDVALASIEAVRAAFGITTPLVRSSAFGAVPGQKTEMIAALCREVGATTFLSGTQARVYLDVERLARHGVAVEWQAFTDPTYRQVHPGAGFVPRLAALDLLLAEGGEGFAMIRRTRGAHREPVTEGSRDGVRLAHAARSGDRTAPG